MSATPTASHGVHHQSAWFWVMCLTGVDYFSTLGYQPSIAFVNAGQLAPLATVILVLVTLFGALPVYGYVAGQSPHGQGSIGMLEQLLHGWKGKFFVLVLLGFAATDFVITKTLSAADAAEHIIHNPLIAPHIGQNAEHGWQVRITMFLLVALGAMFLKGMKEVIGLAVVLVVVFLTINAIVIGLSLSYVADNPQLANDWWHKVTTGEWNLDNPPVAGTTLTAICLASLLLFPKLALGLSGFETGVAVMPLIKGRDDDDPLRPRRRIANARKLLVVAALIMSVLLLGSAFASVALIEPEQFAERDEAAGVKEGAAHNRTLAYLAHGEASHPISPLFGDLFGTIYDVSTVLILWFAGASAMSGLLNLVPQYLPRYGMSPDWLRNMRPLVVLLTLVNLVVTWVFDADVQKQGGAYATGVMVLISSACLATVVDRFRKRTGLWLLRMPWGFLAITSAFFYMTGMILWEKSDGIKIAGFFVAAILATSIVSRLMRSKELRFMGFRFTDDQSKFLWDSMKLIEFPVLVPHRPGRTPLAAKEKQIREDHRLGADTPIVFIEAILGDPSDFYQQPVIEVQEQEGTFTLRVTGCSSISHVITALGLELSKYGKPPEIHFGWSDESPVAASFSFLLFGQGNVPWMVRELILRSEPDPAKQPRVIVG